MNKLDAPEINIAIFGFVLNFVWEVWQAPLFQNMTNWTGTMSAYHCTLASLGDVVILLVSFCVIALAARSRSWILHPKIPHVAGFIALGFVITVIIEAVAIQILHRWQYTPAMPTLPILGTGITPILQWLVIPPIIIVLMRRTRRCSGSSLLPLLQQQNLNAPEQNETLEHARKLVGQWPSFSAAQARGILLQMVRRVSVKVDAIEIDVYIGRLVSILEGKLIKHLPQENGGHAESIITLHKEVKMQRCGFGIRMVIEGERAMKSDPRLLTLISKAHAWKTKLLSGHEGSTEAIAR
jgi:hypothetical protein